MTPEGSLHLPRPDTEFRAARLGIALRGLAAELVAERRKVADLRREITALRAQRALLDADAQAVGIGEEQRPVDPRSGRPGRLGPSDRATADDPEEQDAEPGPMKKAQSARVTR